MNHLQLIKNKLRQLYPPSTAFARFGPSDYFLLQRLEKWFDENTVRLNEEARMETNAFFQGIERLWDFYNKCITTYIDFFEELRQIFMKRKNVLSLLSQSLSGSCTIV